MSYISPELRRFVSERGGGCCEYCRLSQLDSFLPFEIDHIIAEKHRGATAEDNLCLSCPSCNGYKGSDIASIDPDTQILTALYNPRTQRWDEHFQLREYTIEPLTAIGRVTVLTLRMNSTEQMEERRLLVTQGRYPCGAVE
ncbi:MAG: HNH endonuclease [Anaerolineae bacterium]|nr:HNH endonuclease [Anaerolineae bacterium]